MKHDISNDILSIRSVWLIFFCGDLGGMSGAASGLGEASFPGRIFGTSGISPGMAFSPSYHSLDLGISTMFWASHIWWFPKIGLPGYPYSHHPFLAFFLNKNHGKTPKVAMGTRKSPAPLDPPGSLIFVQELAEKLVKIVEPRREQLDACLCFPSMPEATLGDGVAAWLTHDLKPNLWLPWKL